MDKKELQTYRSKTQTEREKEIYDARVRLNSLRFDLASGKVKNIKEIRDLKRKVARLFTIQNEKK